MSSTEANQPDQQVISIANPPTKRKWYLLMSNPSKSTHLGTLLRCAAAFQVHQVLLVGYDKFNCMGSFGSHLFLDIVVFPTWESVCDYLRRGGDGNDDTAENGNSKDDGKQQYSNSDGAPAIKKSKPNNDFSAKKNPINIIGIQGSFGGGEEIFSPDGVPIYKDAGYTSLVPTRQSADGKQEPTGDILQHRSFPVDTRPFSGDVCFMLSKDRKGLPFDLAQICSGFVHVPHLSFEDVVETSTLQTAQAENEMSSTQQLPRIQQSNLIDLATTMSIVLHHYTAWAGFDERTFDANQKFVKDNKPNARRRLCRVYSGTSLEKKKESSEDGIKALESSNDDVEEQEAMGAMALFSSKPQEGGDY